MSRSREKSVEMTAEEWEWTLAGLDDEKLEERIRDQLPTLALYDDDVIIEVWLTPTEAAQIGE